MVSHSQGLNLSSHTYIYIYIIVIFIIIHITLSSHFGPFNNLLKFIIAHIYIFIIIHIILSSHFGPFNNLLQFIITHINHTHILVTTLQSFKIFWQSLYHSYFNIVVSAYETLFLKLNQWCSNNNSTLCDYRGFNCPKRSFNTVERLWVYFSYHRGGGV